MAPDNVRDPVLPAGAVAPPDSGFMWPPSGKEARESFFVMLREIVESCWNKWRPNRVPCHDLMVPKNALGDIDDFFNGLSLTLLKDQHKPKFRSRGEVVAYVDVSVRNLCAKRSGAERRYRMFCGQIRIDPQPPRGNPEGRVEKYLSYVSDELDREILRRFYCEEGKSFSDIARELGCSPSTVSRRHWKAVGTLRARFRSDPDF